jgi:predicted dehydrogenase
MAGQIRAVAALPPIRVGVVGLGYFGSRHLRHFAAQTSAQLVGVVDSDLARATAAADPLGVEAFARHRDLIGKIDAVSIVVPTTHHHAIARDFIDAGVHVLVEKPIASDAKAAADLVTRAAKAGTVLQVGHIERFAPAFSALRQRVFAPSLIESVRRTPWSGRAADVDVVLDLMIHDIDLALTLAGAPVVSLRASGESVVTRLNDVAEARLTFANGVVATLSASRVAEKGQRSLFVSEPGRHLAADLSAQSLVETTRSAEGDRALTVQLDRSDNLAAEIADFIESVRTGRKPLVDGKAGLEALAIADEILVAIAAGHRRSKETIQ